MYDGYAGRILDVDLTSGRTVIRSTSDYAGSFIGGRGIGTRLYWENVPPSVKPFDPENPLIFVTGPATGVAPAGSKWQIFGKSPATNPHGFSYSTLGGRGWGSYLKYAGCDALVIRGRAPRPVYLLISGPTAEVEIRDASYLWGRGTVEVQSILGEKLGPRSRIAAIGVAGENLVSFATILADGDASGSSGFGAVMGSKNLKAVAVAGHGRQITRNLPRLKEITGQVQRLLGNRAQVTLVDLPPGHRHDKCAACPGCKSRSFYTSSDGIKGKYTCTSGIMYQDFARSFYGEWTEVPFLAERLCDHYGLDSIAMMSLLILLATCTKAGEINEAATGLPLSKIGSLGFIEELCYKIARREGFGDVLARGPVAAAEEMGRLARRVAGAFMAGPQGHTAVFDPRMLLSTALPYALEPRQSIPQVAELGGVVEVEWLRWLNNAPGAYVSTNVLRAISRRFWGSDLAVDFSTYDGKALAAVKVQDRVYGNDCLPLCFWMFPIWFSEITEGHVGDPTIESSILSAVTGQEVDEEGLYRVGERVFNLQRAIMMREGRRSRDDDRVAEFFHNTPLRSEPYDPDCLLPGRDGEVISRKGEVLDRQGFERMKDEFYALRGWDVATGLQRVSKLRELGLGDVAEDLARRGLAV